MNPLELVKLKALMAFSCGRPDIRLGLVDGPVAISHSDLVSDNIHEIQGKLSGTCSQASSAACLHGTFVAGILKGRRGSVAPAICPDCTLLVRPIFGESPLENGQMPAATPEELADAINDCVAAGVLVLNLSVDLNHVPSKGDWRLQQALDSAARSHVIIVAAAGNRGEIGSSIITRHPWVIPVVACDYEGKPLRQSNLGSSIGRRGLCAPGEAITSLGVKENKPLTFEGTSAAAPFVTGTIALLWSVFPGADVVDVKAAVTRNAVLRRNRIVPPLLDAQAAYQAMTRERSH